MTLTYGTFLIIFLGLPLLALGWLTWRDAMAGRTLPGGRRAAPAAAVLLVHVILAVVYTTPWDNYLVATRVWFYDPARVLGITLGWVPLEEYTFFVLQTLLTGLWLLWLARRLPPVAPRSERDEREGMRSFAGLWPLSRLRRRALAAAALVWLASVAVLVLGWAPGIYLALTLGWMIPPVALQLAVGADILWQQRRWVALALVPPVLYLSAADSLAISQGVWTINPAQTSGLLLAGVLPIEEFIFFTITNVLIVFGMSLMLAMGNTLRQALGKRTPGKSMRKERVDVNQLEV